MKGPTVFRSEKEDDFSGRRREDGCWSLDRERRTGEPIREVSSDRCLGRKENRHRLDLGTGHQQRSRTVNETLVHSSSYLILWNDPSGQCEWYLLDVSLPLIIST